MRCILSLTAGGLIKSFTLHDRMIFRAPFKTRSLRFEWETMSPPPPAHRKNAMNGAQILLAPRVSSRLLTGPPAHPCVAAMHIGIR